MPLADQQYGSVVGNRTVNLGIYLGYYGCIKLFFSFGFVGQSLASLLVGW